MLRCLRRKIRCQQAQFTARMGGCVPYRLHYVDGMFMVYIMCRRAPQKAPTHPYTTPAPSPRCCKPTHTPIVLLGWFCMYGGAPKHQKNKAFRLNFDFCLNLGICLNWGRVQTCPSRSGRFTTCAIEGVTTRTSCSGFFLVQIVLKVRLLLRSAFCLFPHLPKKKSSRLVLSRPVELEAPL